MNYDTKTVRVFEEDIDLPIGKYLVKMSVQFQEKGREAERVLVVDADVPYAHWQ